MQPRLAKRDCLSGPGREQLQQWFVAQDKLFERCLVCSQNSRRRLLDRSLAVHPCFLLLVSGSDQTPAHRPLAHFLRGTPACYCCLDRDFFIILPFCLCLALQEPRVSEARQVCAEAPVFPGSNIIRLCVRGVPQLASEPASLSTRGVNSGARDMGSLACVDRNVQFPKNKPSYLVVSSRPVACRQQSIKRCCHPGQDAYVGRQEVPPRLPATHGKWGRERACFDF